MTESNALTVLRLSLKLQSARRTRAKARRMMRRLNSLAGDEFDVGHEMLYAAVNALRKGHPVDNAAASAGYAAADSVVSDVDDFIEAFARDLEAE